MKNPFSVGENMQYRLACLWCIRCRRNNIYSTTTIMYSKPIIIYFQNKHFMYERYDSKTANGKQEQRWEAVFDSKTCLNAKYSDQLRSWSTVKMYLHTHCRQVKAGFTLSQCDTTLQLAGSLWGSLPLGCGNNYVRFDCSVWGSIRYHFVIREDARVKSYNFIQTTAISFTIICKQVYFSQSIMAFMTSPVVYWGGEVLL